MVREGHAITHDRRSTTVMKRRVHDEAPPQPCMALDSPVHLTVWRKSLLFNSEGYTVYDNLTGRVVFRVDNYAHNWREEAVLMDSTGNVLLTVQRSRKKLGLKNCWKAYKGDKEVLETAGQQQGRPLPLFRATKALCNSSCTVMMTASDQDSPHRYRMKWSRQKEFSKIYHTTATDMVPVAEVCRKSDGPAPVTLLSKDVLSLRVQPGMDQALVMAMLMIADAMR